MPQTHSLVADQSSAINHDDSNRIQQGCSMPQGGEGPSQWMEVGKNAAVEPPLACDEEPKSIVDHIKNVIGSCGGIIDITSYLMEPHSSCGADSSTRGMGKSARKQQPQRSRSGLHIPRSPSTIRRENATLEFNSNEFADDMSALSDNTLQEMERAQLLKIAAANYRLQASASPQGAYNRPGAAPSSQFNVSQNEVHHWPYGIVRDSSNDDRSLAVSTSGSSSSVEGEGAARPIRTMH